MSDELILVPQPNAAATTPPRILATPFQFATTGADILRLRAWFLNHGAGGTLPGCVQLVVRQFLMDGSIQLTNTVMTPTNDGVATVGLFPVAAGYLQTATIVWNGPSVFTGVCYVALDLVRGANLNAASPAGQLIGGYIRPGGGQAWPGSPIVSSVEGRGFPRIVETTAPVGLIDQSITQGLLTRWRMFGAHAIFIASAAAATRTPGLVYVDPGGVTRLRMPPQQAFTAGQAGAMTWGGGALVPSLPSQNWTMAPLMNEIITVGAGSWQTQTNGALAGDSYSEFRVFVEEWLEANV